MRDLFGDDGDAIASVLTNAAASFAKSMEQLGGAAESGGIEAVHDIKGTAGNIGAAELRERAATLERALRGTNGVRVDDALGELRVAFERFQRAVHGGTRS